MIRVPSLVRKFAALFLVSALAVPASLTAPAVPALAQSDSAKVNRVVSALRGISTLQADFTQTDRNGQRVNGKLTLKRPGRIRFQYDEGVNMLIVGDGKSLTLVDYDVRQVQRWPIRNSPLGALLDPSRDVKRFGRLKPTRDPSVTSIEVRDREHPEYGIITLIFVENARAPGGLELVSWVALDSQNKRTTIRLSNHRYGLAVSNNTFRWRDPRPKVRR